MEFTSKEKELLIVTVTQSCNELQILDAHKCVRVGDKDFPAHPDDAIAHEYIEALKSLIKKKYVFPKSQRMYNLTSSGIEIARKLAENSAKGGE